MSKLTQLKTAQSIETAAANEGIGGAGVGIGVGVGMGNMFTNAFNQAQQNVNTPPPVPQPLQFFLAVNGQQSGPFGAEQLAQMAQSGSLTRETLVWKAGMAAWAQAATVTELAPVFNTIPPPPPPVG